MMKVLLRAVVLASLGLLSSAMLRPAAAADGARTAILCAYAPEWQALLPAIEHREERVLAGAQFVSGDIAGKPVVLVETGISMVNAAMAAQLALDHYAVKALIVMGIAGGVDKDLHIGDVAVPVQWSQYLESVFARDNQGTYVLPDFVTQTQQHFGIIYPQPVEVGQAPGPAEPKTWFAADAHLLEAARAIAPSVRLEGCDRQVCSAQAPRMIVGGNGVSGQSFVDNKAFRDFVQKAFAARALDMESAAVAQVAYANRTPFIALRSLSDLAGGDADANQMKIFETLAARNATTVLRALLQSAN